MKEPINRQRPVFVTNEVICAGSLENNEYTMIQRTYQRFCFVLFKDESYDSEFGSSTHLAYMKLSNDEN